MLPVTVRMKTLDGTWETAGRDRFPGVVPESVQYDFNDWGPDTASFVLRRLPGDRAVDLNALTDVQIEIGGVLCWDGRVRQDPSNAGVDFQTTISCEGAQYELDDDTVDAFWAHTSLTDFRDHRSYLEASLSLFTAPPTVEAGDGGIRFGWPLGSNYINNGHVGVTLDMGVGRAAKRIVVDAQHLNVSTAVTYVVRGSDVPNAFAEHQDSIAVTNPASAVRAGTFTNPRRYVHILMFLTVGAAAQALADIMTQVRAVRIFADTAYESGNASVLRSHHVVRKAVDDGTTGFTQRRVTDATFDIPEYAPDGGHTPREHMAAINAYENRRLQVAIGRDVVFEPRPTTPAVVAGPGSTFDDTSGSNAEDLYNKAVVEGEGPDGSPVRVVRYATDQPGVIPRTDPSITPDNPSFATVTTGWTVSSAGTLTRDTTVFRSSPASGKMTSSAGFVVYTNGAITGTLIPGITYTFEVWLRGLLAGGGPLQVQTRLQSNDRFTGYAVSPTTALGTAAFQRLAITYIPTAPVVDPLFGITLYPSFPSDGTGDAVYIDDFAITFAAPTLADRRGKVKAKTLTIESRITDLVATRFADLFVQDGMRTTTRGSIDVPAGGLRRALTDEAVPPAEVGYYVNELVRLPNEVDPDTGGLGRDVRVVGATYSHADGRAQLSLDSTRGNFQALLARLAVVTGNWISSAASTA